MVLARGARMGALVLTAVGLAATVTVTLPAQAETPAYAPGDLVTVNGISVTAPATAGAVALSVDRADGSSQTLLVTTDAAGQVTVGDGDDGEMVTPDAPADGSPPKCNDSAYSLINGASWPSSYNWHFKKSTTPNELTKKGATKALKESVNNITGSKNGCGLADQVGLRNDYKGSTNQSTDVTPQLTCKSSPQPQNVTAFGAISAGGGNVLAATCTYSTGANGNIVHADVLINTNFEWWTGGGCSSAIGLRAVQTHEYGHAVGMGHVNERKHGNLTMSTNINGTCSNFEASLGRGDVLGLRDLY